MVLESWKPKKQDTVSCSTSEAECRSRAYALKEIKWLKAMFQTLGVDHSHLIDLHCDDEASIHIAANPVFHERTKHNEFDCHRVLDAVLEKIIATTHVSSKDNVANLFTKALPRPSFERLMFTLGVPNYEPPT